MILSTMYTIVDKRRPVTRAIEVYTMVGDSGGLSGIFTYTEKVRRLNQAMDTRKKPSLQARNRADSRMYFISFLHRGYTDVCMYIRNLTQMQLQSSNNYS